MMEGSGDVWLKARRLRLYSATLMADFGALRRDATKFWLAVVGETNYRIIEQLGFPFYALDITKDKLKLDIHGRNLRCIALTS
jgi:hypothetical protein